MRKATKKRGERIVTKMLEFIGEDTNREGLTGTPDRVVRMWEEMFRGYNKENKPKITTFTNGNDGIIYDQMITDSGDFYSQCEHHMVPFFGKYWFAYIPNEKGKLLGLSKVARVVDFYSAKLQIQERLVNDIITELWEALSQEGVEPKAMGVVMEAEHLCKTMRGVKKKGKMRTVCLLGEFKTGTDARTEFLRYVGGSKNE